MGSRGGGGVKQGIERRHVQLVQKGPPSPKCRGERVIRRRQRAEKAPRRETEPGS